MKAAVLSNPNNKTVPLDLVKLLGSFESVIAFEDFSGEMFSKAFPKARLLKSTGNCPYVECLEKNVNLALDNCSDVVICLGGDGLSSYVASFIIKNCKGKKPSMIGWAGGTANVGPIVTSSCSPDINNYKETMFDSIEVKDGDKVLGYAFNDLIIGSSFLGTVDNKMVNLEARAMAQRGEKKICNPSEKITSEDFEITLNGKRLDKVPFEVKQICVSTLQNENLYGRAVLGGLGQAMGMDHPAAAAFMDRIAVDSREENWSYKGLVNTSHLCFDSNDELEIKGLTEEGQIIIDGNPFVRNGKSVGVRCVPDAITVLRSDI